MYENNVQFVKSDANLYQKDFKKLTATNAKIKNPFDCNF